MANFLTSVFFPVLHRVSPQLQPINDLEKKEDKCWEVVGHRPQFELKHPLFSVLSGWVSVRVVIESEEVMNPVLYFDFGEGFSQLRAVTMIQVDENVYQADLDLPEYPQAVRFDPCEELTTINIPLLQFRAHSDFLHIAHQFMAIAKHDHKTGTDPLRVFRKSYARYKKHKMTGMLDRLQKEYKQLYPFRRQRATPKHIKYLNWIRKNEKHKKQPFDEQRYKKMPLISIIMPTYNTPAHYLRKAIDSVIEQTYPHWELCIADDASSHKETRQLLEYYKEQDKRIHVLFREENGHISLASNSALALASGEYVTFLDHDDMLAPNALSEIVHVVNTVPEVQFIYSDEDKIDELGRRFEPHFKSGWNPDMLLSQNYIAHLTVIKRTLLEQAGHFRVGYEGAQDHELFLRVTDLLKENEIVHIEKILYHWRAFEGSTAFDPLAKTYTSDAGLRAIKDFFENKKMNVDVQRGLAANTYKVNYPLEDEPLVSLIVPTRDGYEILSLCIESILKKTFYKNYEIIIVDNQSTEKKTLAYLDELCRKHRHIRVLPYDDEFNYAAINNYAVKHAKGELIGLVNNDIEVITEHWLSEMVQHALRDGVGAVGAKLYYDDHRIQHAGVVLGIGGVAGHSHKFFKNNANGYFSRLKIVQNYAAVTSACLLVQKSIYEKVGGMNEANLKVAFNDVDLCLKIHTSGYRNVWSPYVELHHHESVSRGAEDTHHKKMRFARERAYMERTWQEILQNDPYYNSNLTKIHEDFSIKTENEYDK